MGVSLISRSSFKHGLLISAGCWPYFLYRHGDKGTCSSSKKAILGRIDLLRLSVCCKSYHYLLDIKSMILSLLPLSENSRPGTNKMGSISGLSNLEIPT